MASHRNKKSKKELLIDKYLKRVYYNQGSAGGFGGLSKLWAHVKTREDAPTGMTHATVKKWLREQDTWSVFKSRNHKFKREKIIAGSMWEMWEGDLADLSSIKKYNDGYSFLLFVTDIFSKFAWIRPLKSKKAIEVTEAMDDILSEAGKTPLRLRLDLGSEFKSRVFKELMKKKKIHMYHSYSESHSCFVERLIQSVKRRMFAMFYHNQSYRYIDKLQDLTKAYNASYHSTIKMAPDQVNEGNQLDLYLKVYMPIVNEMASKTPVFKFEPGDHVRVSYSREPFSRSYQETYSEEIFTIKAKIHSIPVRYELQDLLGEAVKGSFYEAELVKVPMDSNREFKIEKILGYRKQKNKPREAKVRWYGYGSRHDSFIPVSTVKKLTGSKKNV